MTVAQDHPNHRFTIQGDRVQCTGCTVYFTTKERKLMALEHPTPCRLQIYTPTGWVTTQDYVMLLHPERYPERLEEKRKFGRALELTDGGKPTGKKWEPSRLPPRAKLVPTDSAAWGLPDPNRRGMCHWCGGYHGDPFDGSCII